MTFREVMGYIKIELDEVEDSPDFDTWAAYLNRYGTAEAVLKTGCRTAGEALDAAVKWANDRRLYLPIFDVNIPLLKKGEKP